MQKVRGKHAWQSLGNWRAKTLDDRFLKAIAVSQSRIITKRNPLRKAKVPCRQVLPLRRKYLPTLCCYGRAVTHVHGSGT
jgi:hypothetical protein